MFDAPCDRCGKGEEDMVAFPSVRVVKGKVKLVLQLNNLPLIEWVIDRPGADDTVTLTLPLSPETMKSVIAEVVRVVK